MSKDYSTIHGSQMFLLKKDLKSAFIADKRSDNVNAIRVFGSAGQVLKFVCVTLLFGIPGLACADQPAFGPLYQQFGLTLAPGERTEWFGPLFYTERKESTRIWAVPPVLSYT